MKPNERWVMTECSEWSLTMRLPLLTEGETAPTVNENDGVGERGELREVAASGEQGERGDSHVSADFVNAVRKPPAQ